MLGSKFRGSGVVDTEVHQVEYSSRRTRGAEIYRWLCQNGCRYSVRM